MARFSQLAGFTSGRATVTTAGTPVQLSSTSTVIPPGVSLVIKSANANTGTIHVGNSSDNANNASSTVSFRLLPNEAITLEVDNLLRVWVDSTVSGEIVEYIFER